jgi:hypothetical protein
MDIKTANRILEASRVPVLNHAEFSVAEIGEPVDLELWGQISVRVTWLGVVDGQAWTLADACRLMCDIADEKP